MVSSTALHYGWNQYLWSLKPNMVLKIICPNASLQNYNLIKSCSARSFTKNPPIIFCFFPGWRKALKDNKSFNASVEAAYLQNRICNAKSESWSITFALPHASLLNCVSPAHPPPPAQVGDSPPVSITHPSAGKGSSCSPSYARNGLEHAAAAQVLWKLQTTLRGEVNLVKMLWTRSYSPNRVLRQDWGQYVINSSLIISTNIHF